MRPRVFDRLSDQAAWLALGLGHLIGPFVRDTHTSVVAECLRCENLVAVDSAEEPPIFGRVVRDRCQPV